MSHSRSINFAIDCLLIVIGLLILRGILHFALPRLARIRTPKNYRERVLMRYQGKDFGAWMFAWFKTGLDAMFGELPELLQSSPPVKNFLDLGCGFGIAGCFLLEWFKDSHAYAVDPSAHRINGALAAYSDRGSAFIGAAPDFEQPQFPDHFDAIMALDMIHYLSDADLDLTLARMRSRLLEGGFLLIRSPVKFPRKDSLRMTVSQFYWRCTATYWQMRTVEQVCQKIAKAGFDVTRSQLSGKNPELFWFVANASAMKVAPDSRPDHERDHDSMNDDQRDPMHAKKFVDLLQPTNPA